MTRLGRGALFEREDELEIVAQLAARALVGDATLALVEGPAGIGKSRLLAEARIRVEEAGFRVLVAGGGELERDLPFGVVRQLFESLLLDGGSRGRLLKGSAEAAARVFVPPTTDDGLGPTSFEVLHGLFRLTTNIAEDVPLCLVVDDVQWRCAPRRQTPLRDSGDA